MSKENSPISVPEGLTPLDADTCFQFACHPGVPCFNECCRDLTLMLSPYDALKLRLRLGLASEDFLKDYCAISQYEDSGFPFVRLRMTEDDSGPCPFVTDKGCTVYEDRPAPCRTYPLGRATRPGHGRGVIEQFVAVRENHCRGFEETKQWTPSEWMKDQDLDARNASSDRFMQLMAKQQAKGTSIDRKQATMVLLALYQTDRFGEFLRNMKFLSTLEMDEEKKEAILEDEERRLDFAMDWVELSLFGAGEDR